MIQLDEKSLGFGGCHKIIEMLRQVRPQITVQYACCVKSEEYPIFSVMLQLSFFKFYNKFISTFYGSSVTNITDRVQSMFSYGLI